MQVVDDRSAALVADVTTLVSGETADLALDGVEGSNAPEDVGGHGRALDLLIELAAHVRPAEREADLLMTPGKRGVGAIDIDLQDACKALEMRLRSLGLAIGSVDIGYHWRITTAPWPVIAGIGPDLAGLGLLPPRLEHGRGGLVGKQPLGASQSVEDVVAQRAQIPCCPADPVCKGGTIQLDALPGIDLRLPVERQAIGIFGYQHLRDQCFGGDATFNDPSRGRSLDDRALT